jgi:EmrB/QacA subfamily drug resistance transporter
MSTNFSPPDAAPADDVPRRVWAAIAIMLVGVFMELMDVTMANVAVPSMRGDLHASYDQVQWVVAGYSLAFAVGLLTGGRLGDILGRKRMFATGLAAFILSSLMSGAAPNASWLIGGRVLQGLAAAVMLPQVLASITVWFPAGKKREAAFGLFGSVTGIGGVVAPLIGGSLISADLFSWGWRPIFLINIPIGLAALAATLRWVPESSAPDRPRLDLPGAAVAALGVFLLVFPIIQGRDSNWPIWGWILLAASAPTFAAFAVLENRRARRGMSVLIDLTVLRRRGFSAGLAVTLVFFGGVTATAFVLMLTLQSGYGYSALRAGLCLVPLSVALIIGSGLSIGLSKPLGRIILQVGCLTAVGGALWLGSVVGGNASALDIWDIVPPLAVFGLGLGLTVAPLTDFVLAGIPEHAAGSASGLQATTIQVGNAVGVAVLGSIFFSLLTGRQAAPHFATATRTTFVYVAIVFAAAAALVFLMVPTAREQAVPTTAVEPAEELSAML